jgi:predicted MPP superfamily phosphohydrolase
MRRFRRRHFIRGLLASPFAIGFDAVCCEPNLIKLRHIHLKSQVPGLRWAHFTDVHHKGDRAHLERAVEIINDQKPDFVCFTGDLVEDKRYVDEALEIFSSIKAPLYGIPGNHDYWAKADFEQIKRSFAKQDGKWLMDDCLEIENGKVRLWGVIGAARPPFAFKENQLNLLMSHYPVWVERLQPSDQFHLIMSGHSHGGQVRIPLYGALIVPFDVNEYELGMYQTPSGPMYVNPGIGYFYLNVRFCCRPEVTIFES